jgi:hypothetical protein
MMQDAQNNVDPVDPDPNPQHCPSFNLYWEKAMKECV